MAAGNVVAEVRKLATAALKSGHALHGVEQAPSKWASAAGFDGSAASPLRAHMARSSGNGCGRTRRYPKMTAEVLLETLDLADQFAAAADAKKGVLAKRIGTKVRPTTVKQAKTQAKAAAPAKRKTKSAA